MGQGRKHPAAVSHIFSLIQIKRSIPIFIYNIYTRWAVVILQFLYISPSTFLALFHYILNCGDSNYDAEMEEVSKKANQRKYKFFYKQHFYKKR